VDVPSQLLRIEALRRPLDSAQYTSHEFADFCAAADITRSVGRTGVCWDNAAAESFFATLKNEMYHRQRFDTHARARFAIAEYIEIYYNRKRMHSTLGYRTPHQTLTDYQTRTSLINNPSNCPRSLTRPSSRFGLWNEIAATGEAVGTQSYSKCGLNRLLMAQASQSSGLRRRERRRSVLRILDRGS
jgi:Integrase core domain